MKIVTLTVSALALGAVTAGSAAARDQIQIAGSSTVLPYATIVAEAFGENTDFPTPVVESGGSSAGLKRFCAGLGDTTVDVANSSRPIKSSEIAACAQQGVTDIIEVRIGYDGIVFASDLGSNDFVFTPSDWFRALAKTVVVDGKAVENSAANWRDVNAQFPDQEILAFIPGTKHGTREVFEEKVILQGCEESGAKEIFLAAQGSDEKKAKSMCMDIRTDGRSVDIDGDYTETLSRIASAKNGIGVFGLSFYENNTDKLKVAPINGIIPNTETIASGEYPVSRPLYFYVKKAHIGVIPGLKEYADFFVADELAGPDGPLAAYGLVSDPELAATQQALSAEQILK